MLLEVDSVSKNFGGLMAVNDVSFSVKKGEIFSIIGPNGSGKTTLFNLISGFLKVSKGAVRFNGDTVTFFKPHQMASRGIGRTFQHTTLFPDLRVVDHLVVGHRLRVRSGVLDAILRTGRYRADEEKTMERAVETLQFIELAHAAYDPVDKLTQEEQKRLAIGMALMGNPDLLLLDEPTGCVNVEEINKIIELIERINREKGVTICLIEHKMRVVMGLAHQIAVLNYGKKIAQGIPQDIRSNDEVIKAYLGGGYVA